MRLPEPSGPPCRPREAPRVALIAPIVLACAITIFARHGTYVATPRLHGPGLLLDGAGAGGSPPSSLAWLHRRLVGNDAQRGGNVVVLRASYSDVYDRPFWQDGRFASVQTVLIPPCAPRAQVDRAASIVDRADAVYFAGGDQAHYVAWKGSALIAAVKRVYARGGVVGGGSAGLAIQGAIVYDSVAGDRLNQETTTADAVRDPLEARISFTTGLFAWPPLADTITDTHFVTRDRFGRSVVFLARILSEHLLAGTHTVYALGVDAGSAVVVGPAGAATLLNGSNARGAYLIRADTMPQLVRGRPLRYTVAVSHVWQNGERFDLLEKTTGEPWYSITVDGSRRPIYSRDPYAR
jgi:cyanophycinase-like exopeptidase